MERRHTSVLWRGSLVGWLVFAALPAQDGVVRAGPTFEVVVHPGKEPEALVAKVADEALSVVESAAPVLAKWQLKASKPVTVHLHLGESSFRETEAGHSPHRFQVESFVSKLDGVAHTLLWPHRKAEVLEQVGLAGATADHLVVSAVQSLVMQQFPTAKQDPWLAEIVAWGLLEVLRNPTGRFGADPGFDSRRSRRFRLPRQASQLEDWPYAKDPSTRDALDQRIEGCCMIAQLGAAAGGTWAKRLLTAAPKGKKPHDQLARRLAALAAGLGADEKKRGEKWSALLGSLKPAYQISSGDVAKVGERLLLVGGDEIPTVLTGIQPLPAGDYAIRGRFEVGGTPVESRIQLDWDQETLLGVFFGADVAFLSRWDAAAARWHDLLKKPAVIRVGVPVELSVEVRGRELVVLVDGVECLRHETGSRTMHHEWSVAIHETVLWAENLRVEALGEAPRAAK
jgi:hypothetical protein